MAYRSLNDAADVTGDLRYGSGRTGVWYAKPEFFRDLSMGPKFAAKRGIALPTSRLDLLLTHTLVGLVDETNPEDVFVMMQGEVWSPMGEASGFLRSKGLTHTSMSVGDVLVLPNGDLVMVDTDGFDELTNRPRLASAYPSKISTASLPPAVKRALVKTRINKRAIFLNIRPSYTLYSAGDDGSKGFTFVINLDTGSVDEYWGAWGGGGLGVKPSPVDSTSANTPIPLPDNIAVLKGQIGGRDPYVMLYLSPGGFQNLGLV